MLGPVVSSDEVDEEDEEEDSDEERRDHGLVVGEQPANRTSRSGREIRARAWA